VETVVIEDSEMRSLLLGVGFCVAYSRQSLRKGLSVVPPDRGLMIRMIAVGVATYLAVAVLSREWSPARIPFGALAVLVVFAAMLYWIRITTYPRRARDRATERRASWTVPPADVLPSSIGMALGLLADQYVNGLVGLTARPMTDTVGLVRG
jgi:hypothetical protein